MAPLRLITFDVTNTIIRVAGGVGKQYAHIAKTFNRTVDPAAIDTSFRNVYKGHIQKYPNFGVGAGLTSYQWWTDVVCQTFAQSGSNVPDVELLQLSKRLYQYFCTRHAWEVLPGAETTLQTLKAEGFKLGVISNFDERLETILSNVGLKNYFDFILTSSTEKVEKPHPDIFQRALCSAGVTAEESMHVGDNYRADYLGANNAGMRGVLVWNHDKEVPSDVDQKYILTNLSDILKLRDI